VRLTSACGARAHDDGVVQRRGVSATVKLRPEELRGQGSNLHRLFQGQVSYRLLNHAPEPGGGLEPPTFALRGRCSGTTELPRHDCWLDWEAGHDPAPPAWKASALPAYATPSCSRSGRHDSNVHEPECDSTAFEAAAAADFATPGWCRWTSGAGDRIRTCTCHGLSVVRLPVAPRRQKRGRPCRIPTDGLRCERAACSRTAPTGDEMTGAPATS
jgi:hypothetical protein